MNQKVFKTLEFDKILKKLSGYADSAAGKAAALQLVPSSDLTKIRRNLEETADAASRLQEKSVPGFSGVRNLEDSLKRLEILASLSAPELLRISDVLTIAARIKAYDHPDEKKKPAPAVMSENAHYTRNQRQPEKEKTDALSSYFQMLEPESALNKEITRCILSEDEVADDASSGLFAVRRRKKVLEERIHSSLSDILNSSRSMLMEPVITMRDGRYCLPVKSEYKSSFAGMVHDQSSTGSTLFIEPMSVIRLNNEIRELEADEKKEIEKVLAALSDAVRPHTNEIRQDISALTHLDFVFAKAKYAESIHGTKPLFNEERSIRLISARHPLIDPEKVVPINVSLGETFSMLVITGPNTGGKTVCLKTIGLLQLMGQSGLFVPAFEGAELGVFREIFADIGDEQSIEQSLSTFSAHMTNTVRILSHADSESLCLFDELGAGTDPTEGAALAISILDYLKKIDARTAATTHYAELKTYALTTDGVENASCEFDVETLSPTYRLLIGVPGKSNAFAISKKLGLPEAIIDDAKSRMEKEDIRFEDVIASLEESRVIAEKEKAEIEAYKKEIEEYKRRARESSQGLEKGREKILKRAREEAAQILADAKETADSVVKEIRKEENGGKLKNAENARMRLNQKLRSTQASLSSDAKQRGPAQPLSPKKIHVGDTVRVLSMNITGTVSTLPDRDNNLYVVAGIIRTKVNIRDLELLHTAKVTAPEKSGGTRGAGIGYAKAMEMSPEINLIGETTADARPELLKYLDDAFTAHLPQVRIVHGRGTGVLRKMVENVCKNDKHVVKFRLGEYGEGGDGVTIAYFRE